MSDKVIPESPPNSVFPVYPLNWPESPISHALSQLSKDWWLDQISNRSQPFYSPLLEEEPSSRRLCDWSDSNRTNTNSSGGNDSQLLQYVAGNLDSVVGIFVTTHIRIEFEDLIKMFVRLPNFSIRKFESVAQRDAELVQMPMLRLTLIFSQWIEYCECIRESKKRRYRAKDEKRHDLSPLECVLQMLNLKSPSMLALVAIRIYLFEGATPGFRSFIEMTQQNFRICVVSDAAYWNTTSAQQPFILDLHINEHLQSTVLSLMHKLSLHWVRGGNQGLSDTDLRQRLPDLALHGPHVKFICYQGGLMLSIGLRHHVNRADAKASQILDDPSTYRATSIVLTGRNTIWGTSIQALWAMLNRLSDPDKLSVTHPKVEEFLELLDLNYLKDHEKPQVDNVKLSATDPEFEEFSELDMNYFNDDNEKPQADYAPETQNQNAAAFPGKTDSRETPKHKFRESKKSVERSETCPSFNAHESQNLNGVDSFLEKQDLIEGKSGVSKLTIDLEGLKPYFSMTLKDAAKELNVGMSTLKRRCRKLRLERWPRNNLNDINGSTEGADAAGPHQNNSQHTEPSKLQEAKNIPPTCKTSRDKQVEVEDQMQGFLPDSDEGSNRYKTESTSGKKRKISSNNSCQVNRNFPASEPPALEDKGKAPMDFIKKPKKTAPQSVPVFMGASIAADQAERERKRRTSHNLMEAEKRARTDHESSNSLEKTLPTQEHTPNQSENPTLILLTQSSMPPDTDLSIVQPPARTFDNAASHASPSPNTEVSTQIDVEGTNENVITQTKINIGTSSLTTGIVKETPFVSTTLAAQIPVITEAPIVSTSLPQLAFLAAPLQLGVEANVVTSTPWVPDSTIVERLPFSIIPHQVTSADATAVDMRKDVIVAASPIAHPKADSTRVITTIPSPASGNLTTSTPTLSMSNEELQNVLNKIEAFQRSVASTSLQNRISSLRGPVQQEIIHFLDLLRTPFEDLIATRSTEVASCFNTIQAISSDIFTPDQHNILIQAARDIPNKMAIAQYYKDDIQTKQVSIATIRDVSASLSSISEKTAVIDQQDEALAVKEKNLENQLASVRLERMQLRQEKENLCLDMKNLFSKVDNGNIKIQAAQADLRRSQTKLDAIAFEWKGLVLHFPMD